MLINEEFITYQHWVNLWKDLAEHPTWVNLCDGKSIVMQEVPPDVLLWMCLQESAVNHPTFRDN